MYNPFKEVKITNKGKTLQFVLEIEEFHFAINQVVIMDSSQYGSINPENYGSQMAFAMTQSSEYWHDLGGGGVYVEMPISAITDNSKVHNTGMFILTVFLEAVHPDVESYNISTATFNLEAIYKEALHLVKKASAKCEVNSKKELLDLYWKKLSLQLTIDVGDFTTAVCLYNDFFRIMNKKAGCIPACKPSNFNGVCGI